MNIVMITAVTLVAVGLLLTVVLLFLRPATPRRQQITVADLQARIADEKQADTTNDDDPDTSSTAPEPSTPADPVEDSPSSETNSSSQQNETAADTAGDTENDQRRKPRS